MPAPKNNKFYQLRKRHGRKKYFQTPNDLTKKAAEYFDKIDSCPWITNPRFHYNRATFLKFAGICRSTYDRIKDDPTLIDTWIQLETCFLHHSREGF